MIDRIGDTNRFLFAFRFYDNVENHFHTCISQILDFCHGKFGPDSIACEQGGRQSDIVFVPGESNNQLFRKAAGRFVI
jgi:hypothetical protein